MLGNELKVWVVSFTASQSGEGLNYLFVCDILPLLNRYLLVPFKPVFVDDDEIIDIVLWNPILDDSGHLWLYEVFF